MSAAATRYDVAITRGEFGTDHCGVRRETKAGGVWTAVPGFPGADLAVVDLGLARKVTPAPAGLC